MAPEGTPLPMTRFGRQAWTGLVFNKAEDPYSDSEDFEVDPDRPVHFRNAVTGEAVTVEGTIELYKLDGTSAMACMFPDGAFGLFVGKWTHHLETNLLEPQLIPLLRVGDKSTGKSGRITKTIWRYPHAGTDWVLRCACGEKGCGHIEDLALRALVAALTTGTLKKPDLPAPPPVPPTRAERRAAKFGPRSS
jgi:hypothetical protein